MTTYNNQPHNIYKQNYLSSTDNQNPIQVSITNNTNAPVNSITNYQVGQGRISAEHKYQQKQVLTKTTRPHYDQKFSNKKSKFSNEKNYDQQIIQTEQLQSKVHRKCCTPIVLGIIGFLALAGIITAILIAVLDKEKIEKNLVGQNEENGKDLATQNIIKKKQKTQAVVIKTVRIIQDQDKKQQIEAAQETQNNINKDQKQQTQEVKQIKQTVVQQQEQEEEIKKTVENDIQASVVNINQNKKDVIDKFKDEKQYNKINSQKLSNTIQNSIKIAFEKIADEGQVITQEKFPSTQVQQ